MIQNSADSIGKKGRIILRLQTAEASLGGKVRPAAIVSVEDNGKGIPPDVQKRLFDPFFTTKEGGTGLGLALVKDIVTAHGGKAWIESNEPSGCRVLFSLPVV